MYDVAQCVVDNDAEANNMKLKGLAAHAQALKCRKDLDTVPSCVLAI